MGEPSRLRRLLRVPWKKGEDKDREWTPLKDEAPREDPRDAASYRTHDSLEHFRVRVVLRRATAAQAPITLQEGGGKRRKESRSVDVDSDEDDGDGGRDAHTGDRADAAPDLSLTVGWQEKVFGRRELERYADPAACADDPLAARYSAQVAELEAAGSPHKAAARGGGGIMFTYVDADDFVSANDYTREVSDSQDTTPQTLIDNVVEARRRHGDAHLRLSDGQPVRVVPRGVRTHHVPDTACQTMHIMADLVAAAAYIGGEAPSEEEGSLSDVRVLCSLVADAKGVVTIRPDFNRSVPPYRIESVLHDVFEFRVENASRAQDRAAQEREREVYRELYHRHADLLANRVGTEFVREPDLEATRVWAMGEIVCAKGFESNSVYVHYALELPRPWSAPDPDQPLAAVSAIGDRGGSSGAAALAFPFEWELLCAASEGPVPFPRVYLQVVSLDSWERYRVEGYGYFALPDRPGSTTLEVTMWRPLGSVEQATRRFFVGGAPELEDLTYTAVPSDFTEPRLSKLGFRTVTTGSVTVRINTVHQSSRLAHSNHAVQAQFARAFGRLSLDTTSAEYRSTAAVLEAFARARKRLEKQRTSGPKSE